MTTSHDPLLERLQRALAGRYSVERELGRGGMGVVYLAREVALERLVAIKVLPPDLAATAVLRERFLREARTAARLVHPNIVPIHAVEAQDGLVWFVMSWIRGETLGARVRRAGPLPAADAARIVQEAAWALAYAHRDGIVHRDVKPDNILLDEASGRALLADFGIARVRDRDGDTPAGDVMGTAAYMSPEQAAGEPLDGRSDLYALGVTAFLALTGELPFEAASPAALLGKHLVEPAPPVAALRPDLPPALAAAVDRCLRKDPAERFASADELAEALARALEATPPVPETVRRAQDEARQLVADVGGAGAMTVMAGIQAAAIALFHRSLPGMDPFAGFFDLAVVLGGAGLLGARGSALLVRVREAVARGATAEDFPRAEPATPPPPRGLPALALRLGVPFLLAAWGWMNDFNGLLQGYGQVVGGVAELVTALMVGRAAAEELVARRRGFWRRFWSGRAGRFLVAKATFGLRRRERAVDAARTEVVLADAAEALLDALPAPDREALAALRPAIRGLEAEAVLLRQRARELDEVLAAAGAAEPARLEAVRGRRAEVGERLATSVAALEGIRLDLLTLRAGIRPTGGLTAHLEAALRLGEDVDARLAAARDLQRLLGPEGRTPPEPTPA